MLRSLLKSCKQVAQGLAAGVTANVEPKPAVLFAFASRDALDRWHVFTDAYFGGRSSAALTFRQLSSADDDDHDDSSGSGGGGALEFAGAVTRDAEPGADLRRGGYAVASSKVTRLGDYFDLSGYSHLVLDVLGDGRTYLANVRTDSLAGTGGDIWQAPFRTRAGEWARVRIPLGELALTYQGQLVERRLEFQADKVISLGVAATAGLLSGAGGGAGGASGGAGGNGGSGARMWLGGGGSEGFAAPPSSSSSSSVAAAAAAAADAVSTSGGGGKAAAAATAASPRPATAAGGEAGQQLRARADDDNDDDSADDGDEEDGDKEQQEQQAVPPEPFRLLIRRISAEGFA